MKRHSFAKRLSIETVLLASVFLIITMVVVAFKSGRVVERKAVEYTGQCIQTSILDVQSLIAETENLASSVAKTAQEFYNEGHLLDTASYYNLLHDLLADHPSLLGCGFYFEPYLFDRKTRLAGIYANYDDESGGIVYEWNDDVSYAEDEWDYTVEDWYALCIGTGKPVWQSPFLEYFDTESYHLISMYSYPMRNKAGEYIGTFSVDVSLDGLFDRLVSMRIYPNSNVILTDSALNYICNPLSKTPNKGSMYDTPFIPGMSYVLDSTTTLASLLRQQEQQSGRIWINENRKYSVLVVRQMSNGWSLCASALSDDIFSDLVYLRRIILILCAVMLLLLYFFNKSLINNLARPIKNFAKAASKISDGKFDIPIPEVKTNDELMELGNALRFMQKSVTEYIDKLQSTTAEKERLKSELDVARNIQSQMLTKHFPQDVGIYATSVPAREVGGDLYDFFVIGNDIYFIVGDVSGKGVPAALLMAITIAAFRAAGQKQHHTKEIVSLINDTFCKSSEDLMFVTLVVGKIDIESGTMDYCNAGHNPMVLVGSDGKASFVKAKTNVACGVLFGFPYSEDTLKLERGSRLIVYSDGITEAENPVKELYSDQRLLDWSESNVRKNLTDKDLVDRLMQSVNDFADGAEPNDDRTILSLSV